MLFATSLASDFVPALKIGTVTWTHNTYKMSNTLFCTAPIHTWSLRRTFASLFPPAGFNNVSTFLGQEDSKLYFFLRALIAVYTRKQASSRTS